MTVRFLPIAAAAALAFAGAPASAATAPHFKIVRPMFVTIPHSARWHHPPVLNAPQLAQWNGSFTDHLGQTVNYTMVGTDPNTTNVKTTIKVFVIPLKMVFGPLNGNMTFDPMATKVGHKTVVQRLLMSPLFRSSIDYVQGGVDLGKTQYIDAYQRGNFWSAVQNHPNYHVKLGKPAVLPEYEIDVSPAAGTVMTNPFGTQPAGQMEVDLFDQQITNYLTANAATITPDSFPLFVSVNTYLTDAFAVCCIGGYHSATAGHPSGQTYAYATYETEAGSFSQDVSAFSHEIGEWMDDPFTDNSVNCTDNTLMENGDPLENNANYGDFPYTVKGFTYNLQSLVFIGYFGAPPSTSVNNWLSFQNDESSTCPGQP
ncbi:MAG: hypothetical protein JOY77_09450 [Alphaproteobacteria bacterium]|nr:hypothetical protein [Alphaproteobacteria bacterium]MBV9063135.1 hypothetical protein [Alphaproteobacteria bacterium]